MTYRQTTGWSWGQGFFREQPVTVVIIGILLVVALASLLGIPLAEYLAFRQNNLPGIITYPLAMRFEFFSLLFSVLMLFMFGGSLERSWGIRKYLFFLVCTSLATLGVWQLGAFLLIGKIIPLAGPWPLIFAITVAWSWLFPDQMILLYFVLPIKAKWIGWGTIVLLFINYALGVVGSGLMVLVAGFFGLGGVAFALTFIWYQRNWAWVPRRGRGGKKVNRTVITHPSSSLWGALTRPYREWQRRRRVARLQKTFKMDD